MSTPARDAALMPDPLFALVPTTRIVGDRQLTIYPLTFGRARLGIGKVGDRRFFDEVF